MNKPKTTHLEDAPSSLRCYSYLCDINDGQYGLWPVWVEAEKPVLLKNVAPYVRDEAEPVVRPATDARTDAWWPVSRFRANALYSPVGKERKEEERR